VFASTAYDAGAGAVKLSRDAQGAFTAQELYFNSRIKQQHGGMVLVDGYLYGLLESGLLNGMELKTGEVKWQERVAGKGSVIYADGRLYCRSEGKGTVTLVETNPKQYVPQGSFDPPEVV
jgi:outer membrane protein assembly factor BamB